MNFKILITQMPFYLLLSLIILGASEVTFAQGSTELEQLEEDCASLTGEEQLSACDRAIKIDENNISLWVNRGDALQELGWYNESDQALERSLELLADEEETQRSRLDQEYRIQQYRLSAHFAKQKIIISVRRCHSQVLAQIHQVSTLLEDEARLEELDAAINSGQITGEQLQQLQTIQSQVEELQSSPGSLERQTDAAVEACNSRAREALRKVDDNLERAIELIEISGNINNASEHIDNGLPLLE
ncbi:MAG: hypothetical protein ACPGVO_14290 [Spirulinaceae cyanobacterium]